MTVGVDACLQLLTGGIYDLQITESGDILSQDFFDSAIIVSLFAERRANESEVFEPQMRRGWIGNEETPGKEIGSKIWLFEQSRLNRTVINGLVTATRDALRWLIADGFATSIDGIIPVVTDTGISMDVTVRRPNSKVENRHFVLWDNTAIPCIDLPTYIALPYTYGMNAFEDAGKPTRPVDVVINVTTASAVSPGKIALETGGPWHPDTTILVIVANSGDAIFGGGGSGGDGGGDTGSGNLGGGGGGAFVFGQGGLSDDGAHDGGAGTFLGAGAGSVGAAAGAVSTHGATNGAQGFVAINLGHDISVINYGIIFGGGGGGGGGGADIGAGGIGGSLGSPIGASGTGTSPGVGGTQGLAIKQNGYTATIIEAGTMGGGIG